MFVQHKNTSSSVSPCVASPSLSLSLSTQHAAPRWMAQTTSSLLPLPAADDDVTHVTTKEEGGGQRQLGGKEEVLLSPLGKQIPLLPPRL